VVEWQKRVAAAQKHGRCYLADGNWRRGFLEAAYRQSGTAVGGGMIRTYANLGGDSGVEAFEIAPDWIDIYFRRSPRVYRYSYDSCGTQHCEQLKNLALGGEGLNSYITRNVKYGYER
jgi:hypothetical protein